MERGARSNYQQSLVNGFLGVMFSMPNNYENNIRCIIIQFSTEKLRKTTTLERKFEIWTPVFKR